MMARWRNWLEENRLEETHRPGFELVRHFLARSFDSEMVSGQGEWTKVAIGAFAALVSVGALILPTYWQRYSYLLSKDSTPALYAQGMSDDVSTFIAVAMWITVLLTTLQWQSLFPSVRDCMALASLPLKPLQIFRAKFLALFLLFAALSLTLAGPTALVFTAASSGSAVHACATFLAIAGACLFVFFGLIAVQGVLLNILPGRWFAPVSTTVQAVVFILTMGVLPFLGRRILGPDWWPPDWFLGLWTGIAGAPDAAPRPALIAATLAPCVALLSYLVSYHRYRRLLLEAPVMRRSPWAVAVGPRLLELWIGDPREQAAFAFIWKGLARSRSHRLVLLAWCGIALGFLLNGAAKSTEGLHASTASAQYLVVLGPLCVAVFVTIGLRYLFSLPLELRANWVFQTTEREGRDAWMRAVARFVVWCGIVPVFVCALPLSAAFLGLGRALSAAALGFSLALAVFEALFVAWRKLPFTCSYLPGKRGAIATVAPYLYALPAAAVVGTLFLYSSREPTAFLSVVVFQLAAWRHLRRKRLAAWSGRALAYEELPEPDVMSLNLSESQVPLTTPASGARPPAPSFSSFGADSEDRGGPVYWIETILEDVRYGLRLIGKNLALSAVLVVTLAVGIGMNVSVFTLINAIALRPRVEHDPGSFVLIVPKYLGGGRAWYGEVSHQDYLAYASRPRSFSAVSAFGFSIVTLDQDDPGTRALLVSCNFFHVYGLERPRTGRLFLPAECSVPGQSPVVVVSEELWRDRLGADPNLVGKAIQLNEQAFTVVGIAPAGFNGRVNRGALWIPYTAQPYLDPDGNRFRSPDESWLVLNGRLAPGYTRKQAQSELAIVAHQQDSLYPDRRTTVRVTDGSMISQLDVEGRGAAAYWLLGFTMIAMSLVLLITCANVTTLLLARAVARQREIAVRLSLGAARARLLRMLLTESFLIAGLAGAAAVWMAYRVPPALFQFLAKEPPDFPLKPDWFIFSYIAGVVLVAGSLSGLAPALESLKVDLTACLKGCRAMFGKAAAGAGVHGRLVTAQVGMSLVLLVTAGFFGQAHWDMFRREHSYPARNILVVPLRFAARSSVPASTALFGRIAAEVATLPGVESLTYNSSVPLLYPGTLKVKVAGERDHAARPADVQFASPGYFRTMNIPLVSGREFRPSDLAPDRPIPAIVSESFLRVFGLRGDPAGRRLVLPHNETVEVIGVARDVAGASQSAEVPVIYTGAGMDRRFTNLLVRFDRPVRGSMDAVRNRIANVAPDLKVSPRSLQDRIDEAGADLFRVVELVLILGATAFVLAVTGIYGAVAFTVTQRTKDLGIRVALGAQRIDLMREILQSGGKPVVHGLGVGLWFSLAAAAATAEAFRFTAIRLDTGNPVVYAGAALLLALAALGAMLGPARRAASSDAMSALRSD